MTVIPQSLSQPSLRSHLRAVWAIARKDWFHFWRYPLQAISWTFQPIVWLTPIYFMGQVFSSNGQVEGFAQFSGTNDYLGYILIGTILTNFVMAVFWGMGYALKNDMDTGVLEANWLLPIPRLLMLIGRTLTSLVTTAATSTVMLLTAALLFGFRPSGDVLAAFALSVPMLIGLYGFGIAFAALVLIMKDANTLVDVGSYLVQLLSGSSFPVQALPRWLFPLALALPLTYGLDAIRYYLLDSQPLLPIAWELVLLVVFMAVMGGLGAWAFRSLEGRVRRRGTLGQH